MAVRGIVALVLAVTVASAAQATELVHRDMRLPVTFADGSVVELETMVLRPDDSRRHPLVVISHGAPRAAGDRAAMSPRDAAFQANEFARRGWVAAVVMRRGYGGSGGDYADGYGGCDAPRYAEAGRAGADDIRGAIQALAAEPYVDPARIVALGHSAGGFASIALAASPPPGLVAVINFAGGRGSVRPDEVCDEARLIDAYARYGRTARVPSLWIYADNDHFFGPALAARMVEAFVAAGGRAEFRRAGSFADDGHKLFSRDGIPVWTPMISAFLSDHGLPFADRVEHPGPAGAPPGLNAGGRKAFADFLWAPPFKAFASSPGGAYAWRSGRDSAEEARRAALDGCRHYTDQPCRLAPPDDGGGR